MKQTKKLHPFMNHLKKARKQNAEFCDWLAMAEEAFNGENAERAFEYALRAYEKTERTTLICRMMPAYFGRPNAFQMIEDTMLEVVPVKMGFTKESWFCMQIPALLPKKQKGSVDYVRGLLYPALAKFFKGKPPVRYRDCVLIYRHVYNRDFKERQRRDHDNIEINLTTDAVAMYVLPDDSPRVCEHFYCTAAGDEDRTEVYIVPKSDFQLWQNMEPTFPENGVLLLENPPESIIG